MPTRRTRLDLYLDILKAIKWGHNKKTLIMHTANISEPNFNEMLTSLVSQGFVEEVKTIHWSEKRIRTSYKFSPKGEKLMKYLKQCDVISYEMDLGELFKDKYSRFK